MKLIRWQDAWDPCRDVADLQEEMSRLVSRTLTPAWSWAQAAMEWPVVDIIEGKDRIVVRADLPGMKQEAIGVELADGVLTIKGERQQGSEAKDGQVHRVERCYGAFTRSFALPTAVDVNQVSAVYKEGVLEITLPKREEAQPKHVKVNVN